MFSFSPSKGKDSGFFLPKLYAFILFDVYLKFIMSTSTLLVC